MPVDGILRASWHIGRIAPPDLPVYEQPNCPGDGYLWTPGYWAWGDGGYYWVSGDWVMAPEVGFLWTPGYWGWGGGGFFFNEGYWGLSVGFYGGINYGFGYFGRGYEGGRWDNGHFFYNTAYNRVNAGAIHNVYNARVKRAYGWPRQLQRRQGRESTRAPRLKKRLPRMAGILRLWPLRPNMRRLPATTPSNGLPRTTAHRRRARKTARAQYRSPSQGLGTPRTFGCP
jgi:hypothetical protein